MAELALTIGLTFVLSAVLTAFVRQLVLSRGVLDVPNARSSHTVPMPRGGGIAVAITSLLGWTVLAYLGRLETNLLLALMGGGIAVAAVGWVDDIRPLPARARLIVHVAAAIWAMAMLGSPTIQIGREVISLGWTGYALGVAGIVWVLNLFNFMDGIDGIAASEAAFVACAGAMLAIRAGTGSWAGELVLAAACCGFLCWNWPPARIFLGDVGSGFIGYSIAVLALGATRNAPASLLVWLVLGGVFFVDATVTLLRRLARGERVNEAHRSHAYQWLARRWRSHRAVTLLVLLVNLLWLFPWAAVLMAGPSVWVVAAALGPLVLAALLAGAGRAEKPSR